MASATEDAGLFVTSHVPTVHPVMAAKQGPRFVQDMKRFQEETYLSAVHKGRLAGMIRASARKRAILPRERAEPPIMRWDGGPGGREEYVSVAGETDVYCSE